MLDRQPQRSPQADAAIAPSPSRERRGSAPAPRRVSGPGAESLPDGQRSRMESAFGRDFSGVRVHADPHAAALAVRLGARAVTLGSDIFLGAGVAPGSTVGDRLLAHELAHVVQHEGGDPEPGGPVDPERAADTTAEAVTHGRHPGFGLRAAATNGPSREEASWADQVRAAHAETDLAKKSAAMTYLVQQAVGRHGVREAGTSSPAAVDPKDYDTAPTINVDVRLNSKTKWKSTTVASTNAGYTFNTTVDKTTNAYSILGPLALDADKGEVNTRLYADHELFHAGHDVGSTASADDRELAAWTDSFTTYFLQTFATGQAWTTIITYYEGATAAAQTTALDALEAYYNGLSTTAAAKGEKANRELFELWLRRRMNDTSTKAKKLVVDLAKRLKISATVPKDPPATAPAKPPASAPPHP